ncbi:hypothetical protein C8Q72DRAFT_799359 [Fomitopsis betulina]|nr:hypothetical protein C8Q72DRAFT_799359 [Fomitopsis betulina]
MHDERAMSMLTYLNDVHSVRDQIHIRQWHQMTHKDAKARMTPVVKWRELNDKLKCQNSCELGQPSKAPVQDDLHPAADSDSNDESETVAELRSLLGDLSLSEWRRFVADKSIDVTSQFLHDVLSDRLWRMSLRTNSIATTGRPVNHSVDPALHARGPNSPCPSPCYPLLEIPPYIDSDHPYAAAADCPRWWPAHEGLAPEGCGDCTRTQSSGGYDVEEEEDRPKAGDAVGVWLMPDGQPVPPASPAIPSMADGRVAVGRAGLPTPFEFVIGRMSAGPVFR